MARKDFAQSNRNGSSASRKQPEPKPKPRAKAAPARRKKSAPAPAATEKRSPLKLALLSVAAVGGLGYLLYALVHNTDPIQAIVQPPSAAQTEMQQQPLAIPPAAPKPAPKPVKAAEPAPAPVVSKPAPAKPVAQAPKPAAPAPAPEKKYEFYDMLPKSEVETPEVSAYHSTPRTAKLEKQILFQVSSFRNSGDAESLKARMILQGVPKVSVRKTDGSNGTWYRVMTGPYPTRADANTTAAKLYKMNMHPLELHVD